MKKIVIVSGVIILLFIQNISSQILSPFIPVCSDSGMQGWIQAAYNSNDDEYLVVWEDYRNDPRCDIYGRRVRSDGTPIGESFAVCDLRGAQKYWPHLDFDPANNRFFVVFEDSRNGNNDVYGCLLNADGTKVWTDSSETDTCFAISKHPESGVYAPSVSFNALEGRYLVVWADHRNGGFKDVYGQIVDAHGRLLPPPETAHPRENFSVASSAETSQNVPVVSWHPEINEWLVVFGDGLGNASKVSAQRVDPEGRLLMQDGSTGSDWLTISEIANIHHDFIQPRVQFNFELFYGELRKSAVNGGWIECLIAWSTEAASDLRDIHGQRLVFIPDSQAVRMGFHAGPAEDQRFFAAFADTHGVFSADARSNFAISDAPGFQYICDLAYSTQDDEWFAAWGDKRRDTERTGRVSDVYGQRISRQEDGSMVFLNADRSDRISTSENIPIAVTDAFEGSFNILGVAHSGRRNEFFVAYTYMDWSDTTATYDVQGARLAGSIPPPSAVENQPIRPDVFSVTPNYPNPFNPTTEIQYMLHRSGHIHISVYDLRGRHVCTLIDQVRPAGLHSSIWDGADQSGQAVSSGVYIYKCRFDGKIVSRKMTLIR